MDLRELLRSDSGFMPRTQAQALQGLLEGILRPEHYVYLAVNIRPVIEEPWNTQEIDRLLAKPELDDDTAVMLMTIFEQMIRRDDKELALFAAESINFLERRYLDRIQAEKAKLPEPFGAAGDGTLDPEALRSSVRTVVASWRSLSKLSFKRPEFRRFYLGEAKAAHEAFRRLCEDPLADLVPYAETLMELGDFPAADSVLGPAVEKWPHLRKLHALRAKLAFRSGDYRNIPCRISDMPRAEGDDEIEQLRNFWSKELCREY